MAAISYGRLLLVSGSTSADTTPPQVAGATPDRHVHEFSSSSCKSVKYQAHIG